MGILLSDEELGQVERDTGLVGYYVESIDIDIDKAIAKAQLKKVASKIRPSHRGTDGWFFLAMQEEDWQALCEEAKC